MDLVLEDIEDEKLEATQVGSGPAGETGTPAAPAAPRAQGRYLPLLQKDSLERVLGLICEVLEGTPGILPRSGGLSQAPAAPTPRPALCPEPPEPAPAGGTGEPGGAPSPGCSLLSCEEPAEVVLAASPCCDAAGTGIGQQIEDGGEESQAPAQEPAQEPAQAAGEPVDAWRRTAGPQASAAQHHPPHWPEPLGAEAVPALQLGQLLASLQPGERRELEDEVLRQPLFSRAKKLFESLLRSPDTTKVPAPVHEDMLKELMVAALHKASVTPTPTWAPSTPENQRPAQPDLPPSFLQRMIQKLGLKTLGRREAQKP